jgi:brefeldin A-resistance guanine nucleotide exchange factor 1
MHALVRTIFTRLHSLDPAMEEAKLQLTDDDAQEGEIKLTVPLSAVSADPAASKTITDEQDAAVADSATYEKEIKSDEAESQDSLMSAGPKPECG